MRARLQTLNGKRSLFRATFVRFGARFTVPPRRTLLLHNVTRRGTILTDHLWLRDVSAFERLTLSEGDVVEFEATVAAYYKQKGIDYQLSHVTGVRKVSAS